MAGKDLFKGPTLLKGPRVENANLVSDLGPRRAHTVVKGRAASWWGGDPYQISLSRIRGIFCRLFGSNSGEQAFPTKGEGEPLITTPGTPDSHLMIFWVRTSWSRSSYRGPRRLLLHHLLGSCIGIYNKKLQIGKKFKICSDTLIMLR